MALRDVIVAVNHLLPALQAGAMPDALDTAAHAIQAAREPKIIHAQALQLREAQGQTNERLRPILINVAKVTAPLFGRFAWAKRAWLNQQRDLRFGTADVALQV